MSDDVPTAPAPETAGEVPAPRLGRPGVVAGLWVVLTLLYVVDQVRFPGSNEWTAVSSILYLSATPVLTALIAAAIARPKAGPLALAGSLLIVGCIAELLWLPVQWMLEGAPRFVDPVGVLIGAGTIIASAAVIYRATRPRTRPIARTGFAILAGILILFTVPSLGKLDGPFWALSARLSPRATADDLPPSIDQERLWTSQPSLVAHAVAKLRSPHAAAGDTYLVTVGASGSHKLFGREARFAKESLGRAFGAEQRSILLSNDEPSLYRVPLAANSNLGPVLAGIGREMESSNDLLVLYLTSHGSRAAELTTDLPGYQDLDPIAARRLAEELDQAGIRRRVIIVSACFAGSWIKPLATDDTILITAARADRSSFGCSDDRPLTYFGEALLKGPLARGASLEQSFQSARKTVSQWEGSGSVHSEPQAYVGKNMRSLWTAPLRSK